jgi:hypothetical protein
MFGPASLELFRARLKASIPPLLESARKSLEEAKGEGGSLLLFVTEEEARAPMGRPEGQAARPGA